METPTIQASKTSETATSTLKELARLLGRQAAHELLEAEQVVPFPPLNKDEGVGIDQP